MKYEILTNVNMNAHLLVFVHDVSVPFKTLPLVTAIITYVNICTVSFGLKTKIILILYK